MDPRYNRIPAHIAHVHLIGACGSAMAALARESIDVWENFAEVIGVPDYSINLRHGGYLFISKDEKKLEGFKPDKRIFY